MKFPVRQNVTVVQADKMVKPLGFKMYETVGVGVVNVRGVSNIIRSTLDVVTISLLEDVGVSLTWADQHVGVLISCDEEKWKRPGMHGVPIGAYGLWDGRLSFKAYQSNKIYADSCGSAIRQAVMDLCVKTDLFDPLSEVSTTKWAEIGDAVVKSYEICSVMET